MEAVLVLTEVQVAVEVVEVDVEFAAGSSSSVLPSFSISVWKMESGLSSGLRSIPSTRLRFLVEKSSRLAESGGCGWQEATTRKMPPPPWPCTVIKTLGHNKDWHEKVWVMKMLGTTITT